MCKINMKKVTIFIGIKTNFKKKKKINKITNNHCFIIKILLVFVNNDRRKIIKL
jgi:hypothetical protein